MVTYPSTYGVFEEGIKEICKITHDNGGLVSILYPFSFIILLILFAHDDASEFL